MRIERFIAFMIDLAIAALVTLLINIILECLDIKFIFAMVGIIAWVILLCKDCFMGMSIGKRILKIQVIDSRTKQIATPAKCVLRNLFYLVGLIDIPFLFCQTKKLRFADYIVHTEVEKYNSALQGAKFSKSMQAIGYVLIGLIIMELFYYWRATAFGLL